MTEHIIGALSRCRRAYVLKSNARNCDWLRDQSHGESIVQTATQLLGIPYLWGGTSVKGLDCSGFTKQIYFMHGIILARTPHSRCITAGWLTTRAISPMPRVICFLWAKASEEWVRRWCTGIYLGKRRFIHASDYVRINSFDPADPLYDDFNANRYLRTKRIIGEVGRRD